MDSYTYKCYVCSKKMHSLTIFKCHMQRHKNAGELGHLIICSQGNCKSNLLTLSNLYRHIQMYHGNGALNLIHSTSTPSFIANHDGATGAIQDQANKVTPSINAYDSIVSSGVSLVANLMSNSAIPYRIIPEVVDSLNHVCSTMSTSLQMNLKRRYCSCLQGYYYWQFSIQEFSLCCL